MIDSPRTDGSRGVEAPTLLQRGGVFCAVDVAGTVEAATETQPLHSCRCERSAASAATSNPQITSTPTPPNAVARFPQDFYPSGTMSLRSK